MYGIRKLRCEYLKNPMGIDVKFPRISWQLYSDQRDVIQKAYRIQVASDSLFQEMIWDSGKVYSDQSIHVEISQINLVSCKRYYYRVQSWNQEDESTGWSEICFWELGMLEPGEWQADWISAPEGLSADNDKCPQFRRSFDISNEIKTARLYVTSLGLYEISMNGKRVGESYFTPGWTNYKSRLQYQTYDVTSLCGTAENVIGAVLGNGWYVGNLGWRGRKKIYGDRKALLLELHLTYENGETEIIQTDSNWKVSTGPILMSEIYHGETYDARLEKQGWNAPGYVDAEWKHAEILDYTKKMIKAQENQTVKKIEEIQPIKQFVTPKGETVIDMGQNMVGWIRFSVKGSRGKEVILKHAEVLDKNGNLYTGNLRSAKQEIRYVLNGKDVETFEPHFSFQGFRFVQLIGFDGPIHLEDFTGIVLHSEMERTGHFKCSDPLVNQLQHNIVWGQKGNFLDVPTDCPQRDERLGWTGDAQMFMSTAAFLHNIAPFFTKWLRDLESEQSGEGDVPFVIPNVLDDDELSSGEEGLSSAAWGDAAVICPWTLYQNYGDLRILAEQYDSMKAWVEYIRGQGKNEYLWETGFHLGDWLALDSKPDSYAGATDRYFIASVFYAYSVSLLQKAAKALNKSEDIREYGDLHNKIMDAFNKKYVTPFGHLTVQTQTAHVLALKFGLLKGMARKHAVHQLSELLRETNGHLTTGFVGTPYLNFVLSENGHNETAYNLLLQTDYPSWLYQVKKGATTVWEHWDGIKEDGSFWSDKMNSFNHYAYGAVGDWLYRCVAGINTDEEQPGYKHMIIHPQPGPGLTWAEGRLETMYGSIHSSWKIHENGFMTVKISLPANTTATIFLPYANEKSLAEQYSDSRKFSGLHDMREGDDGIALSLGSGDYCFQYPIDKK